MAISDTQKTDYLFKKLGFGITKTDVNSNKSAANESIASPLLLRGDKVWQQASNIPATKPGSTTGVTTVYTGATTVECTADITASTNRTWKTGLTDWIPPEFGSTYLVNVYVHDSSDASNAESISNKVFITGSGNDDEWFFDYQSGVLHFIGDNLPDGVDFTGKSVYVAGARYTGAFGVGSASGEDANLGNLTISGVTVTSTTAADDIILDAEDGHVIISGTSALGIPSGTTAQRPGSPDVGYTRFNTSLGLLEVWDGTEWDQHTLVMTSETITPDGATSAFTLSSAVSSADHLIISINGTLQQPTTAYTVSGTTLTFTETPVAGDIIEVRHIASDISSIGSLKDGPGGRIEITGSLAHLNANTSIATASTLTTIDSFDADTYRTAKYVLQATDGTDFESSEVLLTHDGTTVYQTTYAVINSGNTLGNVSATISGSDVLLQYTPTNNNTDVRLSKNYLII